MSDRDLLQLAAKACGFEHYRYCETHMAMVPEPEGEDVLPFSVWNPLTDDGDAMRLVVMLGLQVNVASEDEWVEVKWTGDDRIQEDLEGVDHFAGTRRAIVRAAAQIGRDTK